MTRRASQPETVPGIQGEKQAGAETKTGTEAEAGAEDTAKAREEKTIPVRLRHKTEYPKHRCAGLMLGQKAETRRVTAGQLEKLRCGPWVEIKEAVPE